MSSTGGGCFLPGDPPPTLAGTTDIAGAQEIALEALRQRAQELTHGVKNGRAVEFVWILAEPGTITGSIGVLSGKVAVGKSIEMVGLEARAPLLARCPDLLVVSTSGAGYDTVDVPACTAAGVLVVNQSGGNADAVAEHTVGMMLSLTKNIPQTDDSLRSGSGIKREQFKGWNAKGRTVGIVGLGEVGSRVARICGLGLQMRVIACDPYLTAEQCQARGATKVDFFLKGLLGRKLNWPTAMDFSRSSRVSMEKDPLYLPLVWHSAQRRRMIGATLWTKSTEGPTAR